jgi:hypothetical protein
MTVKGHSPIAPGPIDACRGRNRTEPIIYLTLSKQINKITSIALRKTVRNRPLIKH